MPLRDKIESRGKIQQNVKKIITETIVKFHVSGKQKKVQTRETMLYFLDWKYAILLHCG